ncbi:cation transport ATPase [Ralstonia pickettii]
MSECGSKGCGCAAPSVVTPADVDTASVDLKRSRYQIDNMDCPTEEALIRNKLAALPGVVKLEFNLMQRSLAVHHQLPSPAPIEQALSAIGMRAIRSDETSAGQSTVLTIRQMDCPTEETLIRGKLAGLPGVTGLDFNLVQRTLAVHHAAGSLPQVLAAIQSLGFEAEVRDTSAAAPASAQDATPTKWWPLAIAGTSAVLAEVVYWGHAKIRPIRYHKPASYVEVCMHASWL